MKHILKLALLFSVILSCESALPQERIALGDQTVAERFLSAMARQQRNPLSIYELDLQTVVLGRMTLRSASFLLQQNEIALYELFNQLNSSDELDINCVQERERIPSVYVVSYAACEPVFMERVRNEYEEEFAIRTNNLPRPLRWLGKPRRLSEMQLRNTVSVQFDKIDDELNKLAIENQRVRELLGRVSELQVEYDTLMAEAIERLRKERSLRSLPGSLYMIPELSQPPVDDPTAAVVPSSY